MSTNNSVRADHALALSLAFRCTDTLSSAYLEALKVIADITHHPGAIREYEPVWAPIVRIYTGWVVSGSIPTLPQEPVANETTPFSLTFDTIGDYTILGFLQTKGFNKPDSLRNRDVIIHADYCRRSALALNMSFICSLNPASIELHIARFID